MGPFPRPVFLSLLVLVLQNCRNILRPFSEGVLFFIYILGLVTNTKAGRLRVRSRIGDPGSELCMKLLSIQSNNEHSSILRIQGMFQSSSKGPTQVSL